MTRPRPALLGNFLPWLLLLLGGLFSGFWGARGPGGPSSNVTVTGGSSTVSVSSGSVTVRSSNGGAGTTVSSAVVNSTSVSTTDGSSHAAVRSCSPGSCQVTVGGAGTSVQVLGVTIVFRDARDGRATVQIENRTVTVRRGDDVPVPVPGVRLRCTDVSDGSVSFEGTSG